MSGNSEGYQPYPQDVVDRLDRQVGKGISSPVHIKGGGGGAYRDRVSPPYIPSTPDTSSTATGQGETNDLLRKLLEATKSSRQESNTTNELLRALITRLSTTDTSSSARIEDKLDSLTDAITLLALPESERTRILAERQERQRQEEKARRQREEEEADREAERRHNDPSIKCSTATCGICWEENQATPEDWEEYYADLRERE